MVVPLVATGELSLALAQTLAGILVLLLTPVQLVVHIAPVEGAQIEASGMEVAIATAKLGFVIEADGGSQSSRSTGTRQEDLLMLLLLWLWLLLAWPSAIV